MIYLLDANVFIEAKNRYYSFQIAPGFWAWLEQHMEEGDVITVLPVHEELMRGKDELSDWIKDKKEFCLPVDDEFTQEAFAHIAAWTMDQDFRQEARDDFLAGADPWLIGKAIAMTEITEDATVVTHEVFNNDARKKVPIPNICRQFGIDYINTFELLRRFNVSLTL